jgi:hypothetical protein
MLCIEPFVPAFTSIGNISSKNKGNSDVKNPKNKGNIYLDFFLFIRFDKIYKSRRRTRGKVAVAAAGRS